MGKPVARQGDPVVGVDTHVVMVPAPPGAAVPTPGPHPFSATITGGTVSSVLIEGCPVAVQGSTARNAPAHLPIPATGPFQQPPTNEGKVDGGSASVFVAGKAVARLGDSVSSCTEINSWPAKPTITAGAATVSAS